MQDRLSTGSVSPSKPVVNALCRSILRDCGKRVSAVLESVLGATPRGFESRVLRSGAAGRDEGRDHAGADRAAEAGVNRLALLRKRLAL